MWSTVQEELIVKDTTKRGALAGAIAQRIRKQEDVYLMAKGPNSVANALSAVCRARSYLEVCLSPLPLRIAVAPPHHDKVVAKLSCLCWPVHNASSVTDRYTGLIERTAEQQIVCSV